MKILLVLILESWTEGWVGGVEDSKLSSASAERF
jgi:hypothetical protein